MFYYLSKYNCVLSSFTFLVIIINYGCNKLSITNLQQSNPPKLKALKTDNYNLFLTYTSDLSGYQFITCDSNKLQQQTEICENNNITNQAQSSFSTLQVTNNQNICGSNSELPEYCVSSFRSAPLSRFCTPYISMKPLCTSLDQLKKYCLNLTSENMYTRSPPRPFKDHNDCNLISDLDQTCPLLYRQSHQCDDVNRWMAKECSNDVMSNTTECKDLDFKISLSIPLKMTSPALSEDQQTIAKHLLDYEQFLARKKNSQAHSFNAFGHGAAISIFTTNTGWDSINKFISIPNVNKWWQYLFTVTKMVTIANISTIHDPRLFLMEQLNYTPIMSCFGLHPFSKSNQPYESTETSIRTNRKNYLPLLSGFGFNYTISRVTSKLSPPIRIGSLVVIPFIATYISDSLTDKAPTLVKQSLDDLFNIDQTNANANNNARNINVTMDKVLPILARSLIFSDKVHYLSLQEYCLPKLENGKYIAQCKPILNKQQSDLSRVLNNTSSQSSSSHNIHCERIQNLLINAKVNKLNH